jgi:hypothetical protein
MLFARVQGSMEWCCPNCGHVNRSSLHYKNSWRIRCNGSDCRRAFAMGLVFYSMASGVKSVSGDSIMPIEVSRELLGIAQTAAMVCDSHLAAMVPHLDNPDFTSDW